MSTSYAPDINSKHGAGGILDAVWAAGERWVAIKAGGGNVGLYEAPYYAAQVAKARALGFKIVHYFASGDQAITTQAKYAVSIIKPHFRDGDAVGWDNEKFAGEPTSALRNDADSALWINIVRADLDCPPKAVWHYGSSGSTFRAQGAWPKVKATGCTIWAAAYPGPPDMTGTGLTYDVHQYTSGYHYPGSLVDTDRNKTDHALSTIFPKRATPKPAPAPVPAVVPTPAPEESDVPVFYKEKSHAAIYAISWQAGKKTHVTAAQWKVAAIGPHTLVVVADGALAAFG